MNSAIGLATNVGSNVAAACVIIVFAWFRNLIFSRAARFWHWAYSTVRHKSYVLIWVDDHKTSAEKICRLLASRDTGNGHLYRALERPTSLFFFSASIKRLSAVVLIDSDVSKLADKPGQQGRIEHLLEHYVSKGGALIGAHDLIYRRVRCEQLQRIFGCRTTTFYPCRPNKVRYRIASGADHHPLRTGLADAFELDDGEVVLGTWAPDAKVVYETDETPGKPLVVTREHGNGRLVWLNSGDKADWLCASLALPEEPLVQLLANGIRWAGR